MSTVCATLREALSLQEQLSLEGLGSYYLHLDDGYHVIAWSAFGTRYDESDPDDTSVDRVCDLPASANLYPHPAKAG